MTYERLSPIELIFLRLEQRNAHLHAGGYSIVEGHMTYEEYRAELETVLHVIPRLRKRVLTVPGHLHRPVLADDPHFDIDYHLRHIALPPPGTEAQLQRLAGVLLSEKLDPSRPLWQHWLVHGLADGNTAIALKIHHVYGDGMSGVDAVQKLEALRGTPVPAWKPEPAPGTARRVVDALVDRKGSFVTLLRQPRKRRPNLKELMAAARNARRALRRGPRVAFNAPISPQRRLASAYTTLDDLRVVRRELGGTVNDVLLAVTGGALRRWLEKRGEDPTGLVLKVMCPVAGQLIADPGTFGNHARTPLIVDLPVGEPDPVRRLQLVRESTSSVKGQKGGAGLSSESLVPAATLASGVRYLLRRQAVNFILSNIPGPQTPQYSGTHKILKTVPAGFLLDHLGFFAIAYSYEGRVAFGLLADGASVPDLDVIATGIEDSVSELVAIARTQTNGRGASTGEPEGSLRQQARDPRTAN